MHIRPAGTNDVPALATFLVKRFHAEFAAELAPVNLRKVFDYVALHVIKGATFLAEHDGQIAGTIAALPAEWWWSDEKHLREGWFYVAPEHRGSRVAIRLIRAMKVRARETGLRFVRAGLIPQDADRKDALFEREGFTRLGGIYEWRPEHVLRQ